MGGGVIIGAAWGLLVAGAILVMVSLGAPLPPRPDAVPSVMDGGAEEMTSPEADPTRAPETVAQDARNPAPQDARNPAPQDARNPTPQDARNPAPQDAQTSAIGGAQADASGPSEPGVEADATPPSAIPRDRPSQSVQIDTAGETPDATPAPARGVGSRQTAGADPLPDTSGGAATNTVTDQGAVSDAVGADPDRIADRPVPAAPTAPQRPAMPVADSTGGARAPGEASGMSVLESAPAPGATIATAPTALGLPDRTGDADTRVPSSAAPAGPAVPQHSPRAPAPDGASALPPHAQTVPAPLPPVPPAAPVAREDAGGFPEGATATVPGAEARSAEVDLPETVSVPSLPQEQISPPDRAEALAALPRLPRIAPGAAPDAEASAPAPDASNEQGAMPGAAPRPLGGQTPGPTASAIGSAVPGGAVGALPQVGMDPVPRPAGSGPEAIVEGEVITPSNALRDNAVGFDAAPSAALLAVILIDDPDTRLTLDTLTRFSFPVTFAVDATHPDATARARTYRDAGFEVMITGDLVPPGATPADVETALEAAQTIVPQAVAVLDTPGSRIQGDRPVLDATVSALQASGHGLVAFPRGLNAAEQSARRAAVPAATVFRLLDDADQRATRITRYLARAGFAAGTEGAVIVAGRTRPDTVTALFSWALGSRPEAVTLAPLSAALSRLARD